MQIAVAGIVILGDKILIGKKVKKEGHFVSGGWHIPGGCVCEGEDRESAIVREYKEETNLDVVVIKKLTTHIVTETDTELSWFICKPITFDIKANDDLSEAKFVLKTDVLKECDIRASKLWPREVFLCLGGSHDS
jgi:8-oxo-dGTP pyrophosphatase MutT (NUDIX family)